MRVGVKRRWRRPSRAASSRPLGGHHGGYVRHRLEGDRQPSEFQALHRKKTRFLWGLMVFSMVYYFLLPIGAAYFQDLFKIKVWGPGQRRHPVRAVRVRRRVGRSRSIYARRANAVFDPMAAEIVRDAEKQLGRPQMSTRRIALAAGVVALRAIATPALAQGAVADKWRWLTFLVFGAIIAVDDVRHVPRGQARQERRRLLCRGRRRVRPAERLGDRRRLPVGGVVPRHRRPDLALRLRRLHVFGRLARRLHHRAAGDRRAVPQHRQVHAGRHPRLPQQPEGDAHRRRALDDHGVDVLPDRADGRRRRAGEDADRHRLRDLGDRRRRADARLRAVRRHGRDDVGADHQGDPARHRVDPARDVRLGAVRLQPARLPDGGRRRRQGAGAGRAAARRRRQEHDAGGARPALPRAGPATSRRRSTRSRSAWRWCSAPPGCRTS